MPYLFIDKGELDTGARTLVIFWRGSQTGYYLYVWLRDNDLAGFHPDTKERHVL
jgi:gamma-butyrobetaine dioxygenase